MNLKPTFCFRFGAPRIIFILLLALGVSINSYCQEFITKDKVDSEKTRHLIDDHIAHYREFKRQGSADLYFTNKFNNKYVFHLFFSPDLQGDLHIYVVNNKGEMVLEKQIQMFQQNPTFDYKIKDDLIIMSYQFRTLREVGPGLSRRDFERRVELYSGKQNTVFKIAGDIEHHSYGEPKAAYSFYLDQKNECLLDNKEIVLKYKYAIWNDTGSYRTDDFLQTVKPDETKEFNVYLNVDHDDFLYDKKKSDKISQHQTIDDSYKKEITKY